MQKYPVNASVPLGFTPGPTFFLIYYTPDETTLYSKSAEASDLQQQLELASELEPDLRDTVECDRKWLVNFIAGNPNFVSFDGFDKTSAIDVKMDGSVLDEKLPFKVLRLSFSSKLRLGILQCIYC